MSTTNTAHTPTPWVYEHRQGNSKGNTSAWSLLGFWGADHAHICGESGWDGGFVEPSEADRAFILRACNSHDALVAALQSCRVALSALAAHPAFHGEAPEFNEGGLGRESLKKARAALQLATS